MRNVMKKLVIAGAALCLLAPLSVRAADLSKADVEKIVSEYIKAHPQDIIDAVQSYQDRTQRAQQEAALKDNKHAIYDDPITPVAGNKEGDVTVVEFFDYNCGYCKKVAPEVLKLMDDDKNVRILFKDYPILGPSSETAAKWALAAQLQGKYFEFFREMIAHKGAITDESLEGVAKDVGLDIAQAKKDVSSSDVMMQIERNRSLAAALGVHGTPAFLVGNQPVQPGAISYDEMKDLVAKERAAVKK